MTPEDGPDIRVLSTSRHTARKPWVCSYCDEGEAAGTRYEQVVLIEDGRFRVDKIHYPGCPKTMASMPEGSPPEWAGHDMLNRGGSDMPTDPPAVMHPGDIGQGGGE